MNFYFFKKRQKICQHVIIESVSTEEENVIKDVRNLFRQEKETKAINERILRYIKNLIEYEEEIIIKQ